MEILPSTLKMMLLVENVLFFSTLVLHVRFGVCQFQDNTLEHHLLLLAKILKCGCCGELWFLSSKI